MFESVKRFFQDRKESSNMVFDLPLEIEETIIRDQVKTPGIARVPYRKAKSTGLSYYNHGSRSTMLAPQYDHQEIETVFDIEGFFARSVRAKLSLFSKECWDFVGPEELRVGYIKARINQIERVTGIPFFHTLTQVARNLIVHSNAYLLKVRKTEASGGKERREDKVTLKPVAGYFSLPPETMYPDIDKHGNITGWTQYTTYGQKKFSTRDIVHFYINKKDGYPLGVPSIVSGLDDIHALRHIEESVEVLIRKNLFPLILFRVGTEEHPAGVNPDGTREIDVLSERIADMPTEGGLVVPERYDVKSVGSEGRAMRVEGYLNHFRERVFADLDVSSVDMGIGGSSNRSTASTMSRNLIDIVKNIQLVIQAFFDLHVVQELLQESTFNEETLFDKQNSVHLKFKEIDTETKTAKENHIVNLYNNNMIAYSEARADMGREPLSLEEEKELWWNKFGREQALIGSVDELSGKGAAASVSASDKPSNQHGQRSAPKLNRDWLRDKFVSETKFNKNNPIMVLHLSLRNELVNRVNQGTFNPDTAQIEIESTYKIILDDFMRIIRQTVRDNSSNIPSSYSYVRDEIINRRVVYSVNKLKDDLILRVKEQEFDIKHIFDALLYRTKLIYNTEKTFAKNLSLFYLAKESRNNVEIINTSDEMCETCRTKLTMLSYNDNLAEEKLPPHHPGCKCGVRVLVGQENGI